MKFPNFTLVFLAAILSGTAILISAIVLDFTGAINMRCKSDGCEIGFTSLPAAADNSADSL